jgi:hypothetical protein
VLLAPPQHGAGQFGEVFFNGDALPPHAAVERAVLRRIGARHGRLEKEEQELLPLAQRVIASEDWFEIGSMFRLQEQKEAEPAATLPLRQQSGFCQIAQCA